MNKTKLTILVVSLVVLGFSFGLVYANINLSPKKTGDILYAEDWNNLTTEIQRLRLDVDGLLNK